MRWKFVSKNFHQLFLHTTSSEVQKYAQKTNNFYTHFDQFGLDLGLEPILMARCLLLPQNSNSAISIIIFCKRLGGPKFGSP